jgi:hypothetical protein
LVNHHVFAVKVVTALEKTRLLVKSAFLVTLEKTVRNHVRRIVSTAHKLFMIQTERVINAKTGITTAGIMMLSYIQS